MPLHPDVSEPGLDLSTEEQVSAIRNSIRSLSQQMYQWKLEMLVNAEDKEAVRTLTKRTKQAEKGKEALLALLKETEGTE